MTNNKVIIDYTKCQYNTFDGGGSQRTKCILDGKFCDCLRDKECYYKQLARKTQECEKLKEENEKIKKQYNCYACNTCNGKEDYRNIKRHCENAIKTLHKYKSALEEIEEVITPTSLISGKDLSADKVAQIQEIINNKVKDE